MSGYNKSLATYTTQEYIKCDICRKKMKVEMIKEDFEILDTYASLQPYFETDIKKITILNNEGKLYDFELNKCFTSYICKNCDKKYYKIIKEMSNKISSFLVVINKHMEKIGMKRKSKIAVKFELPI